MATERIFRVFVSSTFQDFEGERDALAEVFKKLDTLCRSYGSAFQAVDLRWGVSPEAAREQLTMRICKEEIERCRSINPALYFIGLVGERYGWCPLPDEINASDFEKIAKAGSPSKLRCCYALDKNAKKPRYCLLPKEQWKSPSDGATVRENEIHDEISSGIRLMQLSREECAPLCASATEQELWLGALSEPTTGAFCFLRRLKGKAPARSEADRFRSGEKSFDHVIGLHNEIERRLPPTHIHKYTATWTEYGIGTDHLQDFENAVYDKLSKAILKELNSHLENMSIDPKAQLESETREHEEFAEHRTQGFFSREQPLAAVQSYVTGPSTAPFAVHGLSGSGKSTLLAEAVRTLRVPLANNVIVQRFVGATPESTDPVLLLRGMCAAIIEGYAEKIEENRLRRLRNQSERVKTYERLVGVFRECLGLASYDRPLLVVVDALDQLDTGEQTPSFSWVPPRLPPWVKFVVSAISEFKPTLTRTVPKENLIELTKLGTEGAKAFLIKLLDDDGRLLQEEQLKTVLRWLKFYSLPLDVKILFEQLRNLHSDSVVPKLCREDASEGQTPTDSIVTHLLDRLSLDAHHGGALVSGAVGFLAAARSGITDDEMQALLSADPDVRGEFIQRHPNSPSIKKGSRLPQIIWSRLYFDFQPYLNFRRADGTRVLSFFHRQFGKIASEWASRNQTLQDRHRAIANFFSALDQPLYRQRDSEKIPNARKVGELPFQQTRGALWSDLVDTLTDYSFIDAKIRVGGPTQILQDFSRIAALPKDMSPGFSPEDSETLSRIEQVLRLSAYALSNDPTQLSAQISGRIRTSSLAKVKRIMSDADTSDGPRLRPIVPRLFDPESPLLRTVGIHLHIARSVCVLKDGQSVISASGTVSRFGDSSLKRWDLSTGLETTVFSGIQGEILDLCTVGEFIAVAMENGSIEIWDPNGGDRVGEPLFGHTGPVSALGALRDGEKLVSASYDHTIRIWNLENRSSRIVGEHDAGVNGLAVSAKLGILVSVSHDCSVRMWNLQDCVSGQSPLSLRCRLNQHADSVDATAILPDGRSAVTASFRGAVFHWDLTTGTAISQNHTENMSISTLCVFVSKRRIYAAIGGVDGSLVIWDLEANRFCRRMRVHSDRVFDVVWVKEHDVLITASKDTSLKVWDTKGLIEKQWEEAHAVGRLCSLDLDESGAWIRAVPRPENQTRPGKKTFMNLATGEIPDRQDLIPWQERRFSIGKRGPVDLRPRFATRPPPQSADITVEDIDFERSKTMLGYWWSRSLRIYENGEERFFSPDPFWPPNQRVFPNIGLSVNSLNDSGEVRLADLFNLTEVTWQAHEGWVFPPAVSPDGKLLITCSTDYTFRGWDISNRASAKPTLLWTDETHTREVNGVAVARGKPMLVTVSDDWSAILWDFSSGKPIRLARFDAEGPLVSCEISPDGTTIAVADETGVIHVLKYVAPLLKAF